MSEERFDIVVLGATGFTGQFVVDEVARVVDEEGGSMKFAVAGRSMEKLQKVLQESSVRTGENNAHAFCFKSSSCHGMLQPVLEVLVEH